MTPFHVTYHRTVRPLSLLGCVLALVSIIWPGAAAPLVSASPLARSAASQRIDPPAVGYATASDRTLIRWIWNRPGTPTFRVYRRLGDEAETLLSRVAPITNQQAAVNMLNTTDSRWPDLYNDILRDFQSRSVTDMGSFQSYMQTNPLAGQKLAAERYPVALVLGWGYLDRTFTPGATYTYRVEVEAPDGASTALGSVTLVAGQLTPLARPVALAALDPRPYLQPQDGDWGAAQQNLRFDRQIRLRWDTSPPPTKPGFPQAWAIGYDIYRAPAATPDAVAQVNGRNAVQPMPASAPLSHTLPISTTHPYQQLDYYYADEPPEYGDWIYRVAPRDLLGQVRRWPADGAQFSDPITARAYDLMPPPAPADLRAYVPPSNNQVELTWAMTGTADLPAFAVYRTLSLTATVQPSCADERACWRLAATTTLTGWVDPDPTQETMRWYRVQAVDSAGNRSFFAGPAQAVIHDIIAPPPPELGHKGCASAACIRTFGAPDATRVRLYCRLSADGQELPIAEIASSQFDLFDITTVYRPPLPLENVSCRGRAADERGNLSDFSPPITFPLIPSTSATQAPQPIITAVDSVRDDVGMGAQVRWEVSDTPGLDAFLVARQDQNIGSASLVVFPVGVGAREYLDRTVAISTTYSYSITAVLRSGAPYNGRHASSLPRTYRMVDQSQRPLGEVDWWGDNSWSPGVGSRLNWDCAGCSSKVSRWYAVFRSVHRDADYIQITPVVYGPSSYIDASARHNRYWYVVVEFDERTGEPIRYTRPRSDAFGVAPLSPSTPAPPITLQAASLMQVMQDRSSFTARVVRDAQTEPGACRPQPAAADQPLRFGDGFTVHGLAFTSLDPANLAGSGQLRVRPPSGAIDIPVSFSGLTVGDGENHVCSGTLAVDVVAALGALIAVQRAGGLAYDVAAITARPWFSSPNDGAGTIVIHLPDTLRRTYGASNEGDAIVIDGSAGMRLHSDLSFEFSYDFAKNPSHTCTTPALAFNMETLPVTIVPLGPLTINETGITMAESCMRYLDRYTRQQVHDLGERPAPPNLVAADSNDGFLRAVFASAGEKTRITGAGLRGIFATDATMSWIGSYPWGFNMRVRGAKVMLDHSQIAGGSLGGGGLAMAYQQKVSGNTTGILEGSFARIDLDPRGAGRAILATTQPISWLVPGGFGMPAGDWELYLGAVTTAGRPETAMWRTRSGDLRPVGLPQDAALDPGLNRRLGSAPLIWANCAGPAVTFDAAVDTYVRHGGVSGHQKASLGGMQNIAIRGYDAGVDTFDLSFLDNYVADSSVMGEVRLPFPATITIRLIDMSFTDDGCIAGGKVPAGLGEKTLGYWQLATRIRAVEFRSPNPKYSPDKPQWDAMLWTIGALDLPHLVPPTSPVVTAAIPIEIAFQPDGQSYGTRLIYVRPDYQFDGFPLLLEQVSLSQTGTDPGWDAGANMAAPPDNDWSQRGYVALQGALVAPYFGPLQGPAGQPRPDLLVLGWSDYVGFTSQPRAAKSWVDLPVMSIPLTYKRLVYVYNRSQRRGMFVGFEQLPMQVLSLDSTAAIEPGQLGIYLGLSSGPAALRAIAEAIGADPSSPPDATTRSAWASKLAMGSIGAYGDLLATVWGQYSGKTFRDTTAILEAYDRGAGRDLPNQEGFGGKTIGSLDSWGVKLKRIRGDAKMSGGGLDAQLDSFDMFCEVEIRPPIYDRPLLQAERMVFQINRLGDYTLQANNVTSKLFESSLRRLDATLVINPALPQFQGGLTLYDFDVKYVHIKQGTAVLGVGQDLNYIGASVDGYPKGQPDIPLKGTALFGTIDKDSPVLGTGFNDLLSTLNEVPRSATDSAGAEKLDGFYLRLAARNIPITDNGCSLRVAASGEIAIWYWAIEGSGQTYGGRLSGAIYGSVLCVLSARGDLTLIYTVVGDTQRFRGSAWVATGVGFCEPETWDSWASRWWNDDWCETMGAEFTILYQADGQNNGEWSVGYDFDAEGF